MTTLGAPAALHGYRVQALYTLKRILTQADENLIFHPENLEDLDVFYSYPHCQDHKMGILRFVY